MKFLLLARYLLRLYRMILLAALAGLIQAASYRPQPPETVKLADARTFFPDATRLAVGDPRLGGQAVVGEQGRMLGLVITTSPHTDEVIGYAGPSNLLIALDTGHRVIGVRLLASGDTRAHVDEVVASQSFWEQFVGWRRDAARSKVEGVSGSTLTSLAMAEAIERRLGGQVTSLRFPEPVDLDEIRTLIPHATAFQSDDPRAGWHRALDSGGATLGYAIRTSPYTDNSRGYKGPTESLIAIAPDGKTVTGLVIRRSYDTPEFVDRVREDEEFLRLLTGRKIEEWTDIDFAHAGIEGVSGATQTSYAVADGLKRRFAAEQAIANADQGTRAINPGLLAVIGGGLAMAFTRLRASRPMRTIWQGVLIVVFFVWLGDLVSLALLTGWARHGVPWQTAPSVVLLVAVALLVPWATRRQIYCQQLCPHGAAQSWLGRYKRLHVPVPASAQRWLTRLPPALLAIGFGLALLWPRFDLAWLEPFDGWVLKSAAAVSVTIAIVGLIASIFVPQAYCRYGCPTGELLRFVKSSGSHDRLGWRDWTAGGLVAVGALAIYSPGLFRPPMIAPEKIAQQVATEFSGQAFGTTWSVKIRGQQDTTALKTAVAAELERIENSFSHWRSDSLTSQFNASETTHATEQPAELIALVARAQELSKLTGGAYDITVAPLVDAWGFGPSGDRASPPTNDELAELVARTGWSKLIVDAKMNTLRKTHPLLQIDLGSLLQGYAADRVAQMLSEVGVKEFLIDVGGELFARGSWQVAIEDPADPTRPLRILNLANSGLATSGFYRATKQLDGIPVHHLISPQTGRPIETTATFAVVVAPTALEADAWATALLAFGLPGGLDLANQQGLAALFVDLNRHQKVTLRGRLFFGAE